MKILQVPDPRLRKKTKKIEEITPGIKQIARKMMATLKGKSIALAANQVGILKKIIVLKSMPKSKKKALSAKDKDDLKKRTIPKTVLINPEILGKSKKQVTAEEGCLSFMEPEIRAEVTRPAKVTVKAQGLDSKVVILKKGDLFGRALQHEIDHLNGILFVDRANPETIYKVEKKEKGESKL